MSLRTSFVHFDLGIEVAVEATQTVLSQQRGARRSVLPTDRFAKGYRGAQTAESNFSRLETCHYA